LIFIDIKTKIYINSRLNIVICESKSKNQGLNYKYPSCRKGKFGLTLFTISGSKIYGI